MGKEGTRREDAPFDTMGQSLATTIPEAEVGMRAPFFLRDKILIVEEGKRDQWATEAHPAVGEILRACLTCHVFCLLFNLFLAPRPLRLLFSRPRI